MKTKIMFIIGIISSVCGIFLTTHPKQTINKELMIAILKEGHQIGEVRAEIVSGIIIENSKDLISYNYSQSTCLTVVGILLLVITLYLTIKKIEGKTDEQHEIEMDSLDAINETIVKTDIEDCNHEK